NEKIGIIIVTYNPESELLRIINSLENYITVIIDNGSTESETKSSLRKQSFQKKNINFIELEENRGLGFAQNIGISVLEKKNVEFVVLFDQDTMFETVFLENLVSTFYKAESTFPQLGVLVPV
ncbi:glycosyltransferase, partial [Enterococcus faecium]|uniref:glycosyltransferase n=2 Tax=Enterococcus TaxID=1350 RepID=UPI0023B26E24